MSNLLMETSPLPYELPQYDQISVEDFRKAFEAGIAAHREEVDQIAAAPGPIDFDNTVVAYEMSGQLLDRVLNTFYPKESSDGDKEIKDLAAEIAPKLAEHHTWLLQHKGMFARIDYLYQRINELDLDEEGRTLLTQMWQNQNHVGVGLDDETRAKVQQLTTKLSTLETEFSQRVTNDRNDSAVLFDSAEELAGLSSIELQGCAQAAEKAGHPGKYLVELVNTTGHPFQAKLSVRESRKRIFDAQTNVGCRDNENDTKQLCIDIAKLRAELAALFGHKNHMSYNTEVDSTAESAEHIESVVYPMAAAARRNAEAEAEILQREADAWCAENNVEPFKLAAWDWEFFAALAASRRSGVDQERLRNYLEYHNVLEKGVFYAANKLYGITFEARPDLKAFNPDIFIWEVKDADGSQLALFCHDPFARPTKEGGAWMTNLVTQSNLMVRRPVIINSLNIPKPKEGEPILLTWDMTETMFHEFGHALHGIFSNVTYPSVEGTSVARDYVEFPSQINEMWMVDVEVLKNYARHYETGEVLDDETIAALTKVDTFGEGYSTSEYLAAALLDQEWHRIDADTTITDAIEFEKQALVRIGLDNPLIPPRYRSTYFRHTFGGGYDGAYYSYIWAEILVAEVEEWLRANGGLTRANGKKLRDEILSRGRARPEMESFVAFLGRKPKVDALARKRGLDN